MLPLSCLSLSFPSPILKPMDQGVNTALSPLDGFAEIPITENKTKPTSTQKHTTEPSHSFVLRPSERSLFCKTNTEYWIFMIKSASHLLKICSTVYMLCYTMLCYVPRFSGISLAFITQIWWEPSSGIPQLPLVWKGEIKSTLKMLAFCFSSPTIYWASLTVGYWCIVIDF